jgi:hypothetical protein
LYPSCTRIPWEQASLDPETSLFLPKQSTAPQGNQVNRLILSPLNQFSRVTLSRRCYEGTKGKKGTMPLTFKDVRKLALALQNVEEGTSYGTPAFKVGGKLIARLKEDGESLVVGTTFEEREEMMAAEPETYYITDHYLKYPWVLVRLSQVHADALRDLLSRSWRLARTQPRGASTRKPTDRTR